MAPRRDHRQVQEDMLRAISTGPESATRETMFVVGEEYHVREHENPALAETYVRVTGLFTNTLGATARIGNTLLKTTVEESLK